MDKRLLGEIELNRIYQRDCIEGMRMIPDESVDLVVTDPPYGINFHSNHRKKSTLKSTCGIDNDGVDNKPFLTAVIEELNRVLKPNSHIYWFTRWDRFGEQSDILNDYFKVKNSIIWMKNNWSMGDLKGAYAGQYENIIFAQKGRRHLNEIDGRNRHADILQYDRIASSKLKHSHEKPEALIEFLIRKSSDNNEIVIDPFMGSGTTAVACVNTNRNFIGFETEREYVEIANKRLDSLESS